jgi:hypothetical protein
MTQHGEQHNPFAQSAETGKSEWDLLKTENYDVDMDLAPFHAQEEKGGNYLMSERRREEEERRQAEHERNRQLAGPSENID